MPKTFLRLTRRILSSKIYERVISIIDSQELNKIFIDCLKEINLWKKKHLKIYFHLMEKLIKEVPRENKYNNKNSTIKCFKYIFK